MSAQVKAFISEPDSGVTGLRPDLYAADRVWLERTAEGGARRILAETEADEVDDEGNAHPIQHLPLRYWRKASPWSAALAEALAAFVAEDGAK